MGVDAPDWTRAVGQALLLVQNINAGGGPGTATVNLPAGCHGLAILNQGGRTISGMQVQGLTSQANFTGPNTPNIPGNGILFVPVISGADAQVQLNWTNVVGVGSGKFYVVAVLDPVGVVPAGNWGGVLGYFPTELVSRQLGFGAALIGSQLSTSSLPVVIASDQSAVSVRGNNSPTTSTVAGAVSGASVAATWTNLTTFVLGASTRFLYGLLFGFVGGAGVGFGGLRLRGETSLTIYDLVQRVLPNGGAAGNEVAYVPPRDLQGAGFTSGETVDFQYFTTIANGWVWAGLELGP